MSATMPRPLLEFDAGAFAQAFNSGPMAVSHTLADHPLFALEAIAELADRYPGRIERHSGQQDLVTPGGAPELEGPPSETVRGIETNGCWMVFWYIDQVPEYRALLDACIDQAAARLASMGRTVQREAFLFLSAPESLTPVHFDPEHNFLLQIRGRKTMNVCPFASRADALRELDRYHDGGHRNLETLPSEGQAFVMDPGDGVYVPTFMPHWVQNGPTASISFSITFRTTASRRAERIHWVNSHMRRLGLTPRPPEESQGRDRAKEMAWIAGHAVKGRLDDVRRSRAARDGATASN